MSPCNPTARSSWPATPKSLAVLRLNVDGSLDAGFGSGGMILDYGIYATELTLQPDGRIVVAGTETTTEPAMVVLRYSANGTPDATFGVRWTGPGVD